MCGLPGLTFKYKLTLILENENSKTSLREANSLTLSAEDI